MAKLQGLDVEALRAQQQLEDLKKASRLTCDSEVSLARSWVAREVRKAPLVSDGQTLWVYAKDQGIWMALDEAQAKAQIETLEGNVIGDRILRLSDRKVTGVYNCVLRHQEIYDPKYFEKGAPGIACANGFLRVTPAGIWLDEHSPENRALWRSEIEYIEGIDTTPWAREFLVENLFRDDEDREAKEKLLGQFVGASLCGFAPLYAKALILSGGGSNGKTTLLNILDILFPTGSIGSVEPQRWGDSVYVSDLKGILLNRSSEIPEEKISASSTFKAVITGDEINSKRLYKNPAKFRPIAGHLFACNALPASDDASKGFWRRVMVLEFNRDYSEDTVKRTTEEVVSDLLEHKEAIFGWALTSAVGLLRAGEYTIPESSQRAAEAWKASTNDVLEYLEYMKCEPWDGKGEVSLKKATPLWSKYARWTLGRGLKPKSIGKFGRMLKQLGVKKVRKNTGFYYQLKVSE